MNIYTKLTTLLEEAKEHSFQLNTNETITVLGALKHISENKNILDKTIYNTLVLKQQSPKVKNLTRRESQIFNLVGNGFRSKEIALMLSISQATVGTHRKNIIKKLNITGSRQLQALALKYIENKAIDSFPTKNTQ